MEAVRGRGREGDEGRISALQRAVDGKEKILHERLAYKRRLETTLIELEESIATSQAGVEFARLDVDEAHDALEASLAAGTGGRLSRAAPAALGADLALWSLPAELADKAEWASHFGSMRGPLTAVSKFLRRVDQAAKAVAKQEAVATSTSQGAHLDADEGTALAQASSAKAEHKADITIVAAPAPVAIDEERKRRGDDLRDDALAGPRCKATKAAKDKRATGDKALQPRPEESAPPSSRCADVAYVAAIVRLSPKRPRLAAAWEQGAWTAARGAAALEGMAPWMTTS